MYERILVPIDGSDTSNAGLLEACKLAQEHPSAQIRVVHVVDELLTIVPEYCGTAYDTVVESARQIGATLLAHAESFAREHELTVETELIEAMGEAVGELVIKAAKKWPADLIVCGTHGRRGLRRIVMGSDAEYIVRHCPVPVLLIRKDGS